MASDIKLDDYEEVPRVTLLASKWLVDAWEKLGKPQTPLTDAGSKMMAVILATWEELYPEEARRWYEDRKEYQNAEMTITEQIHKHTGRSLASYPIQVFLMMKKLFPNFKATERQNCIKLVKMFPAFRMAKKV